MRFFFQFSFTLGHPPLWQFKLKCRLQMVWPVLCCSFDAYFGVAWDFVSNSQSLTFPLDWMGRRFELIDLVLVWFWGIIEIFPNSGGVSWGIPGNIRPSSVISKLNCSIPLVPIKRTHLTIESKRHQHGSTTQWQLISTMWQTQFYTFRVNFNFFVQLSIQLLNH